MISSEGVQIDDRVKAVMEAEAIANADEASKRKGESVGCKTTCTVCTFTDVATVQSLLPTRSLSTAARVHPLLNLSMKCS